LIESLEGKRSGGSHVRLMELFERLVQYRNAELGHGAAGQKSAAEYERLGRALIAAAAEVFARLDVLAGGRLIYVGEIWQSGGTWVVPRYELIGENALRLPSLELSGSAVQHVPAGDRVYLERAADSTDLCLLHPLVIHEPEVGEVLFLNAQRNKQRLEYLCYTRADGGSEQSWARSSASYWRGCWACRWPRPMPAHGRLVPPPRSRQQSLRRPATRRSANTSF
jgi:hypothetical protein